MEEMSKFDIFFASLAGWILHPGYQREGAHLPHMDDIVKLAEEMVYISDGRAAVIEEEDSSEALEGRMTPCATT